MRKGDGGWDEGAFGLVVADGAGGGFVVRGWGYVGWVGDEDVPLLV